MPAKGQYKACAKKRSVQQRKYNCKPKSKKDRAARNKVRRAANASGRTRKGDGKDIDHKKPLRSGGSNSKSNTRVVSKTKNRARNGSRPGVGGKKKR